MPQAGDAFDILEFGTLVGQFDMVNLPTLAGNLFWDTSSLYTLGSITVVPEPSTLVLLTIAAVTLLAHAYRRQKRAM